MTLAEYIQDVETTLDDRLDAPELQQTIVAWWAQATAHERADLLAQLGVEARCA